MGLLADRDRGGPGPVNECYWIRDHTPDGDPIWQTTCAHTFEFTTGGPKENNFDFCPHCGGKLQTTGDHNP